MKPSPLYVAGALLLTVSATSAQTKVEATKFKPEPRTLEERLSFQSFDGWSPRTHLDADVAMVYGIDKSLPERIKTWKDRGYRIHVMTGVAWGEYQDYLFGQFDGKNHEDESQMDRNGNVIGHGVNVPYMSPGESYGKYLCEGVKRAIDAGAEGIHLEEPEFWVRAGYEPNFKREWKAYYGDDWIAPHSSPDAQYRASKLKYFLYRRALSQVFEFVKTYSKQIGRDIKCYVPTHSLINYASWGIVSPQSSLLDVGCDGYIAQVWTGTSRTPNFYQGKEKERTFETAFLEYGAMQNLVRASGRRMWYLNDPIEDDANHSWDDYRFNWESTLTASLLQPEIWRYEIMPWPSRIFTKNYPVKEASQRTAGEPVEKVPIPKAYETELQLVINALAQMKQPARDVRWEKSGTKGVGVLISDTLMFQRAEPTPSDSHLGSFYGLALPLLKRGIPVEPVQIESSLGKNFLKSYRILVLTYEGQKPPTPEFHKAITAWVRAGGALVIVDNDADPYNAVKDWWNTAPYSYSNPRLHLFETLGLEPGVTGIHKVGKGFVIRESLSPAALSRDENGGERMRQIVTQAAKAVQLPWQESNALVLRRGPYLVTAGLDESTPNAPEQTLSGRFVDLFDAELPVQRSVTLSAGKRRLLVDLDKFPANRARVVAAACRIRNEASKGKTISFHASGIAETNAVVLLTLPAAPKTITLNGQPVTASNFDYAEGLLRLRFPNTPEGVQASIQW
ncbi:hypothetical protein EON80_12625 [bacterium]|nr:MAG: hypothetical protein EON80_12625 [bacterium]